MRVVMLLAVVLLVGCGHTDIPQAVSSAPRASGTCLKVNLTPTSWLNCDGSIGYQVQPGVSVN